jgi:hypothetical protein
MNPTEKAIVLSYLLSKLLNKNLDVVLHEMKVIGNEDAGKMQHRVEKLIEHLQMVALIALREKQKIFDDEKIVPCAFSDKDILIK